MINTRRPIILTEGALLVDSSDDAIGEILSRHGISLDQVQTFLRDFGLEEGEDPSNICECQWNTIFQVVMDHNIDLQELDAWYEYAFKER